MYDENTFQNYIFWLKVKRVFLLIVLSIIGAVVGIVLSQFLIDVLLVAHASLRVVIIAICTLFFFGIALLLTINVSKDVQEGYWKIAVLRKLTVISKKLDALENLETTSPKKAQAVKKVATEIKQEINEVQPEQLSIE